MDILYLLIPLSAALVLGILALFAWALNNGQFDDLEQQGAQIFEAQELQVDHHQGVRMAGTEQSRGCQ